MSNEIKYEDLVSKKLTLYLEALFQEKLNDKRRIEYMGDQSPPTAADYAQHSASEARKGVEAISKDIQLIKADISFIYGALSSLRDRLDLLENK